MGGLEAGGSTGGDGGGKTQYQKHVNSLSNGTEPNLSWALVLSQEAPRLLIKTLEAVNCRKVVIIAGNNMSRTLQLQSMTVTKTRTAARVAQPISS